MLSNLRIERKHFPGGLTAGGLAEGRPAGAGPTALKPVRLMKDWQLASELLPLRDPESEFYTLCDIQGCLGDVSIDCLRRHAVDLWHGRRQGHYRLNFEKALALIKRYMLVGKKRHSRGALEALVEQRRREILAGIEAGG